MRKGNNVVKKIISFILCLALLGSTATAAAAAGIQADNALNDRLTAITLSVKETLGIGDSFTSFSGTLDQNDTASIWSLTWSGDNEQINVTANESGKIVSYNDYISSGSTASNSNGRIPRFPTITIDQAKSAAKTFLNKVLNTKFETVDLQGSSTLDYSSNAVFYLNGNMMVYGIESPVYIGIRVSAATKQVTSFYRSDSGQDYSGVTLPSAAADQAAAAAVLKSTLNMELTYALPGDGTHTARLQYLPNPDGSYVVDAATGKLVDLSQLDYSGAGSESGNKDAAATAQAGYGGSGLTTVEQSAIDKMQGVLSQSALEKNIRAYTELGLTADFKVQSVNYYTYEDDSKQTQVVANIVFKYTSTDTDTAAQYRYISMDAKTGKLISVSSNRIYMDTKTAAAAFKYSSSQTEAVARAFAGKIMPDELRQTALSQASAPTASDSTQSYVFSRVYDAISFPENYINVGVDAQTGYVVSFNSSWYAYEVTFVPAADRISAAAATDKFAEAIGTELKYVSVPTSTQTSGLLLSYTKADTTVWGINATTGELLKAADTTDAGLQYNDIDGNPYAACITKLAEYGIGFPGGAFKPDAQLTQEDALILIESTSGRKAVPLVSSGSTDDLYNTAYSMGILTSDEKDPAKLISRAELTKYIVNALGYGEVAGLSGIFTAGFSDDGSIPVNLVGYVAIAKGLGIVRGDQSGYFKPNDMTTHTMAAIMIYNCLSRK
jgi:hypothetical protein